MPPPPKTQLTAEEYARQAYLRRELVRIAEDLGELEAGIEQEEGEARQAAAFAGSTPTQNHHQSELMMPGSFISAASSSSNDAAAAAAAITDTPQDPIAPRSSLAATHILLGRLHSDLSDRDFVVATARCLELMAQLQESLALQVVYLDSVGRRKTTELAMARRALAKVGLVVGQDGTYYSEAEAEEGFEEGWEDDDDDEEEDDSSSLVVRR
ncbi:hypothetical protein BST61_g11469 [Cercospora zeina]